MAEENKKGVVVVMDKKKTLGVLNAHMETSTVLQNQLYDPEIFLEMQYPIGRLTFGQGC